MLTAHKVLSKDGVLLARAHFPRCRVRARPGMAPVQAYSYSSLCRHRDNKVLLPASSATARVATKELLRLSRRCSSRAAGGDACSPSVPRGTGASGEAHALMERLLNEPAELSRDELREISAGDRLKHFEPAHFVAWVERWCELDRLVLSAVVFRTVPPELRLVLDQLRDSLSQASMAKEPQQDHPHHDQVVVGAPFQCSLSHAARIASALGTLHYLREDDSGEKLCRLLLKSSSHAVKDEAEVVVQEEELRKMQSEEISQLIKGFAQLGVKDNMATRAFIKECLRRGLSSFSLHDMRRLLLGMSMMDYEPGPEFWVMCDARCNPISSWQEEEEEKGYTPQALVALMYSFARIGHKPIMKDSGDDSIQTEMARLCMQPGFISGLDRRHLNRLLLTFLCMKEKPGAELLAAVVEEFYGAKEGLTSSRHILFLHMVALLGDGPDDPTVKAVCEMELSEVERVGVTGLPALRVATVLWHCEDVGIEVKEEFLSQLAITTRQQGYYRPELLTYDANEVELAARLFASLTWMKPVESTVPEVEEALQALLRKVVEGGAEQLSARGLSSLVRALDRIDIHVDNDIVEEVVREIDSRPYEDLVQMTPLTLMHLLVGRRWLCTRFKLMDMMSGEAFMYKVLSASRAKGLDDFMGPPQRLGTLLFALNGSQCRPTKRFLLHLADTAVKYGLQGFNGRDLANLLSLFSRSHFDPGRKLSQLVAARARQMGLEEFPPRFLRQLLASYSYLGRKHHPGDAFVQEALRALVAAGPPPTPSEYGHMLVILERLSWVPEKQMVAALLQMAYTMEGISTYRFDYLLKIRAESDDHEKRVKKATSEREG